MCRVAKLNFTASVPKVLHRRRDPMSSIYGARVTAIALCVASSCWAVTPPCFIPTYGTTLWLITAMDSERACPINMKKFLYFGVTSAPRLTGATFAVKTSELVMGEANSSFAPLAHKNQTSLSADTFERTASTFRDAARYLQLLAGVISHNDQRSDFCFVAATRARTSCARRNSSPNLYNHLALSDTTGGFVSIFDNAAIRSFTLHSGVHDARFKNRLSSVGGDQYCAEMAS